MGIWIFLLITTCLYFVVIWKIHEHTVVQIFNSLRLKKSNFLDFSLHFEYASTYNTEYYSIPCVYYLETFC